MWKLQVNAAKSYISIASFLFLIYISVSEESVLNGKYASCSTEESNWIIFVALHSINTPLKERKKSPTVVQKDCSETSHVVAKGSVLPDALSSHSRVDTLRINVHAV